MKWYSSSFAPSKEVISLLYDGKIIDPSESSMDMVERIVQELANEELKYSNEMLVKSFAQDLGERMDNGQIVMSTPIMTNAGRYFDRPLSACTVPTIDLNKCDHETLRQEINTLHQQGMGTGFDLSTIERPVPMLKLLNDFALDGSMRKEENRPVGNMAVLSVYHPRILDFIKSKACCDNDYAWKFNISVDLDDNFFVKLGREEDIILTDGSSVKANEVFSEICEAAKKCADPGLVFLDRMNRRNPLPDMGLYKTTAPCAEVGLIKGEACQFGYINVGKFISLKEDDAFYVDYENLEKTTYTLTLALDDALSISINKYSTEQSSQIMLQKRKIGIGLCGVADAISIAGLNYDSHEARELISNMLSFINYKSKLASIELAKRRGSALSMNNKSGNRYYDKNDQLSYLYGRQQDTCNVTGLDWIKLGNKIKRNGLLRNTTTIALPPTGRSALIYNASTGIEPHFSLERVSSLVKSIIAKHIGNILGKKIKAEDIYEYVDIPAVKKYLAFARDITPKGHLRMVSSLQRYTDEAISKTINMPINSSIDNIKEVYLMAYKAGVSGVTIYIDGSRTGQPIDLSK